MGSRGGFGEQATHDPPAGSSSQGRGLSFTGEFRHTIDAKGRLIVPSRLREQLENDQVVLTPWPEGCIAMWSGEGWRDLESSLLEQRRSDPNQRKVVRTLAANAHQDSVDKQGRISVPGHLRGFAGIERDCIVIGALDHGEIWSPDRWQQLKAEAAGSLDELTQELNF